MSERDPETAVIDREPVTRAAGVLLGEMVQYGNVLVRVPDVEPEVDAERIRPIEPTDIQTQETAVRLIEEQRLAAHAGAEYRPLDDGRRDAGRRRVRERERLRVVVARHARL